MRASLTRAIGAVSEVSPAGAGLSARPPRPRLAALAHVGPALRDAQLDHGAAARQAGQPGAAVDAERVLEGPARAVGVAEVVDRRALGLDAGLERRDDRVAERRELGAPEAADRAQRMDARG